MNRYMIVIPAKNRSFMLKCDEGGRREAGDPAEAGERICGDRAVGAGRHLGAGGG